MCFLHCVSVEHVLRDVCKRIFVHWLINQKALSTNEQLIREVNLRLTIANKLKPKVH